MPVRYAIMPQRNLALFTYSGVVGIEETAKAVAEAAAHPDNRTSMRHLCDLSQVTGVERNFLDLLKMQASFLEHLNPLAGEWIVVFFAPTRAGQDLAQMAKRSWDGLNAVIVLIHDNEAEALAMLGLPETEISALQLLVS